MIRKQNVSKSVKRRNKRLRRKLKKQLLQKPILKKKIQKSIYHKYQSKYNLFSIISKHRRSQRLFFKYTKKLKYKKKLTSTFFKSNLKYKKSFLKKSNRYNQFKFLLKNILFSKSSFFTKNSILKNYIFILKFQKSMHKIQKNKSSNFILNNHQLKLRKFFLSF